MLLSLSTTHSPATDLGYLLAKHPDRCQSFSLAFGQVHVFYPEATEERCTACLLLEIDPIDLVRNRRRQSDATLAQYVNDRPYVASSFFSVAISRALKSALRGESRDRPELVAQPIPLEAKLSVVPCRGGGALLRRLFEPLGYGIEAERLVLDEEHPEWGDSAYFQLSLSATKRLSELLSHLYVLLPVLDNSKHYWVGRDELEKLLAYGEGWLADHPHREEIAGRYLKYQKGLAREAIERLLAEDPPQEVGEEGDREDEQALERALTLNERRLSDVVEVLRQRGAQRVLDLGCGEGKLLRSMLRERSFVKVAGSDVSARSLEIAASRLKLERMSERQRQRVELFQASLGYRDSRFEGFDAITIIEVIEHIDPFRLTAFERVVFEYARPRLVVLTTPNVEYNVRFPSLEAGKLRHPDHRFEWTRDQFEDWARTVAERHGYGVKFHSIGPVDDAVGAPTQMAVFER